MEKSFKDLLNLLPECRCSPGELVPVSEYFGLTAEDVSKAVLALPENHDLSYKGVRLLLSACLEELAVLFRKDSQQLCEVSVPAPPFVMYALQAAGTDWRFSSAAFFAEIVLRGILLCREPLELTSCARRRCGLNIMRRKLLEQPPANRIRYQLQFGLLCDECVKTGEGITSCVSVTFPKQAGKDVLTGMCEDFLKRCCHSLGIELKAHHSQVAFKYYTRLMLAQQKILSLNNRPDCRALFGNSLALAQSVQLMTTSQPERFIAALEVLAEEMLSAPSCAASPRMYCYFVPFLQPEIDARFRNNGVTLLGNAAFLQSAKHVGTSLSSMTAAWLCNMSIRSGLEEECAGIAAAMKDCGCQEYLSGFFGFDRWLGACAPMQRRFLSQRYGLSTKTLDADFWCENAMFGSTTSRIDQICMK